MEEAAEEDLEKQRVFYDTVRETIVSEEVAKNESQYTVPKVIKPRNYFSQICLLVFLALYLLSNLLVARFQRHISREDCYTGEEDKLVYRIT